MRWLAPLVASLLLLFSAAAGAQVGTVRIASGLSQPTYLTAPPDDPTRLFVTEQSGDVLILDAATGAVNPTPFLSLSTQTLASLAFHPDYASNGFFFVYYQDGAADLHLVRYQVSAGDPDVADAGSATPLLFLTASPGHFGGWIGFGPDGYLYVHIGDGGNFISHDAPDNAQSTTGELFGNALRIDVDTGDDFPADPDRNYAIPAGNPFVGVTGEDEVWAYGLRNPWRGSFDRATGDYYIADVGQDNREEVNFELASSLGGRNYGWRLREGTIATPTGGVGGPQPPGGVDPAYEYAHGSGPNEGGSITGGYVYRGPVRMLRGRYFFADFNLPRVWSIRVDRATQTVSEFFDWTATFAPDQGSLDQIVSFGEDAQGNLYLVDYDGELFRVMGPVAVPGLGWPGLVVLLVVVGLSGATRAGAAQGAARADRAP